MASGIILTAIWICLCWKPRVRLSCIDLTFQLIPTHPERFPIAGAQTPTKLLQCTVKHRVIYAFLGGTSLRGRADMCPLVIGMKTCDRGKSCQKSNPTARQQSWQHAGLGLKIYVVVSLRKVVPWQKELDCSVCFGPALGL